MLPRLSGPVAAVLFCAWAACATDAAAAASPACAATARRAPADARIRLAVDEARRQHQLFGAQVIERSGGIFRVGHHEAEWARPAGEPAAAWQRVATFWRALSDADPPALMTSAGRVARADAATPGTSGEPRPTEVAVREALLRAAIVDTPWSAAFISYLMKTGGFSGAEFEFSDRHVDYVRAALDTAAAEAAGREAPHAFRACDVATTRPRAGDLLCATRARTAGTATFDELAAAMEASGPARGFPMHCDIVVRSDEGGDAKIDTIGGNVVNSVTLSRMTLNARKVLGDTYVAGRAPQRDCARSASACREHLSRRAWVVLLQFRH